MSPDEDEVQVAIGGISYQNWLDVDLDSDIFTPADGFSLTATLPTKDRPGAVVKRRDFWAALREGAKCEVYIGRDRQLAGVIDKVTPSGERSQSRLKISGRDRAAYLVDNDAPALKVSNMTVKTLIEKLIDPAYGIKSVVLSNEENRKLVIGKSDRKALKAAAPSLFSPVPRKSTKIDTGRTIASIIDEHTQRLGLAWWMTASGELFLGKPNYNQDVAYRFVAAEPGSRDTAQNNVESWAIDFDQSDRYSEVRVNGMGIPDKAGLFSVSSGAPKWTATARDQDLIDRGITRKTIIADHDILSQSEAQHRADMEQGKRRLKAVVIRLTVPGFRQVDSTGVNRLYAIDTLASVRIDEYGIDGTYYVTQRRFREDRGRRRTELTLHQKGVWLP
jgi:prophage tail gpP-like protein